MPGTQSSIALTQVTEWDAGKLRTAEDSLAVEEPLEIRIQGKPLTVTMRTPGYDRELAAGLLWSEGLVDSPRQITALRQAVPESGAHGNLVDVELSGDVAIGEEAWRSFLSNSSCGVCGKASMESIRMRTSFSLDPDFRVTPEVLCQLPVRLRSQQHIFSRTGGLHAAALFRADGELLVLREDIGRHNAVDKVVGWALLQGLLPLSHCVLAVSGRGGFEIVQKAVAAGIPVLASVSAPSSLAVKLAREFGLTLVGFLREQRFVVYSCPSRCLADTV
ncbi:MAG TPA: formate dehydrogenase accessory sulfurtransferase FdhD [Terracidiphilus sp.]|nr:formate dehydrogenase accessory sulfurtransferase FdhD [Terracidiphilus sp.]